MNAWATLGFAASLCAGTAACAATPSNLTRHAGICDASAGVFVGSDRFLVANDEDNVLRVHASAKAGERLQEFDLTELLAAEDDEHPEADIEGAARRMAGGRERIYWIASHGTNKNGKARPARRRVFATDVAIDEAGNVSLTPVGRPYRGLVEALAAAPALAKWKLAEAAKIAPEEPGGLNIEGLAANPEGQLLIAFRSPVREGAALIVPLLNPDEVVDGQPPRLGDPTELALGGLGIRSIEYDETSKGYLLVAGPPGKDGAFRLYRWSGASAPTAVDGVELEGLRPEALMILDGSTVQLLSDDGDEKVGEVDCKDAPAKDRSFRSLRLKLGR
jgi:hypothetical protein